MNVAQELEDLRIELQLIQQENKIIKLQTIEYEKEIIDLKQQNQILTDKNNKFIGLMRIEEEDLSISYSLTEELNMINTQNEDLVAQIHQYQALTKRLNASNKTLQTENNKYNLLIQQLTTEKQKKHKIHNHAILKLENKIKELETECDTLRESLNTYNNKHHTWNNYSLPKMPSSDSQKSEHESIFRLKSMIPSNMNSSIPLFNELNVQSVTSVGSSTNYDDIIGQLEKFGYNENEIVTAMNSIDGDVDINQVVEILDGETVFNMRIKSNEIEMKLIRVMTENGELKKMNDTDKMKIKRLQTRNVQLKRKIDNLTVECDLTKGGCKWSQWLSFI
eukprot:552601_1